MLSPQRHSHRRTLKYAPWRGPLVRFRQRDRGVGDRLAMHPPRYLGTNRGPHAVRVVERLRHNYT
jgi:hypothetical protein